MKKRIKAVFIILICVTVLYALGEKNIFADMPEVVYETPEKLITRYNELMFDQKIDKETFRKRYLSLWDKEAALHTQYKYPWSSGMKMKEFLDEEYKLVSDGVENSDIVDRKYYTLADCEKYKNHKDNKGHEPYRVVYTFEKGKDVLGIKLIQTAKTPGKDFYRARVIWLFLINDNGYKLIGLENTQGYVADSIQYKEPPLPHMEE